MAKVAHWRFDIAPVNGVVADDMAGVSGLVATWNGTPPAITQEGGIAGVRVNGAVAVNLTGSIPIDASKGITIAFRGILEANQGWGNIFGLNNGSTTPVGDSAILLAMPAENVVATYGRIFSAWKVSSNDFALGGNVPLGAVIKGYAALKSGAREIFTSAGYTPVTTANTATPTTSTYTKGRLLGNLYSNDSPLKGFFSEIMLFDHYASFEEVFTEVSLKTQPITAIPANQEPRAQFQPQDVAWRGGEGKGFAGPVSQQPITDVLLCQPGQDLFWTRDGVLAPGQGYIESTVTISGEGVRRRVLCYTQEGALVGETWSRASDGKYRFDLLWLNRRYMLVAQDDPTFGPADYNAVAADYQQPTPYAPGQGVGLI